MLILSSGRTKTGSSCTDLFVCGKSCFVAVPCLTQCINVPPTIAEFFADVGVPDLSNGHVV